MAFFTLPVSDLARAKAFFTSLGLDCRDDRLVLPGGTIRLAQGPVETEVRTAVPVRSRDEVDDLIARAVGAGATLTQPVRRRGEVYGGGFRDLDGHRWEIASRVLG